MAERTTEQSGQSRQAGDQAKDQQTAERDADQAKAQQEYMQGLRTPAAQARAAINAAGLPIAHLIPDNAVAFQKAKDGTFTLKLAGEKKYQIGRVTLTLTQNISGKLGSGKMSDVKGISGTKKVAFFSGTGNITNMFIRGSKFVVNTDHSSAKEIEFDISDIQDLKA